MTTPKYPLALHFNLLGKPDKFEEFQPGEALPIDAGGTGGSTVEEALANLGLTSSTYVRSGVTRFGDTVALNSIADALDYILSLGPPPPPPPPVTAYTYWGNIGINTPIVDVDAFLATLTRVAYTAGNNDFSHVSNSEYRVIVYPKSKGLISDIQDPAFFYSSIVANYENPPREIVSQSNSQTYYAYFTTDPAYSPSGKVIRYLLN